MNKHNTLKSNRCSISSVSQVDSEGHGFVGLGQGCGQVYGRGVQGGIGGRQSGRGYNPYQMASNHDPNFVAEANIYNPLVY